MSSTAQAKARIEGLLDADSFVEIGARVTARSTDFHLDKEQTPSDGVVTGYGVIDGNLVYVYSQDASVLGGSVGEMHARKIVRLYDMALKMGAPVIGLIDSAGLRLQEGVDSLTAFGEIYRKMSDASGVIPQITAIFGSCGGGLAILAGLSDFSFIEDKKGRLFINSPNTLDGNYTDKCDTASAAYQVKNTGLIDETGSEEEVLSMIRDLTSFLPENNEDNSSFTDCTDDLNRILEGALEMADDPAFFLPAISDDGDFFETKARYAKEMVTGFARLNGQTIGVIANRTARLNENGDKEETFDPVLTVQGMGKAARFIRFLDAFDIPILTMTNVKGFAATMEEEQGMAGAAASFVSAFSAATVPKVNLITKEAFGSAFVIMNSYGSGADLTLAWPDAQIGPIDAEHAAQILCQGKEDADLAAVREAYSDQQASVKGAAARGIVDEIIDPEDSRKYLIGAFEMLFTKRDSKPAKKHGLI